MSKRRHDALDSDGDDNELFNAVQRHSRSASSRQQMLFFMLFSFINFSALLLSGETYGGNKTGEMARDRVDFDTKIASAYTDNDFERVYRMGKDTFNDLHHILLPQLLAIFFPKGGGTRDPSKNKYLIDTKIRLSIALRFFAGADPLDLFGWHGVSLVSVFISIWGVIDAVNNTDALAFTFPDADEQKSIAARFCKRSGAGFSNVIGAIDGLLV